MPEVDFEIWEPISPFFVCNDMDANNSDKFDSLFNIALLALFLKNNIAGSHVAEHPVTRADYEALVDYFYTEHEAFLAPQQCAAAKKDLDYFLALIGLAFEYHLG